MSRNRGLGTLVAALLLIEVALALSPGAWAQSNYKTLHRFTRGKDGIFPSAGLVFDQAGNLYGTAFAGGNEGCYFGNGCGLVFKLVPIADGSWMESVLYSFTGLGNDGANPQGGLIFDREGNLYGTTRLGGAHNSGTVFKLQPNPDGSWVESVLYGFTGGKDGGTPYAGLMFDPAGNLYGTTYSGGANKAGTVFKLRPHTGGNWTESVLYSFCSLPGCADGSGPWGGLISDQGGNLYGTTWGYEGAVFRLEPHPGGNWTESVIYSFCSLNLCGDGAYPMAALILDSAGNLYGTASLGGVAGGHGVAFELTPDADRTWSEKVLRDFTSDEDGSYPEASLMFDVAGNLYGTTVGGGDYRSCNGGCGVVFKLIPDSNGRWNETVLHRFLDQPGVGPVAGVIFDAAGNLYGTTYGDYIPSFGSVFEIMP